MDWKDECGELYLGLEMTRSRRRLPAGQRRSVEVIEEDADNLDRCVLHYAPMQLQRRMRRIYRCYSDDAGIAWHY